VTTTYDEERMRQLWEEGRLKTVEIAIELGTTLDAVRGTARRRGWERGPILRGRKKPAEESRRRFVPAEESPVAAPRRSGKKAKIPSPPKLREEPGWSTIFTRLDEEHAKMDRVLAETRGIARLHGM
jgi:hypothetical protein